MTNITKEQEDAIRRYYTDLIDTRRNMPDAQGEARISIEISGCMKTLDCLGIKISGVNV